MPEHYASARPLTLLGTRLLIGAVFLWHGVPKAIDWPAAQEKFVGFGWPGFLGPITGVAEVILAALLILGLFHRWVVGALAAIIVGALVTVQIPGGITSGLERDLLILVALLVLLAHGPGAYTVGKSGT